MTKEKAIEMINEYLLEPNSIDKNWVEVLKMCKNALVENDKLKAEIEDLKLQIKTLLDAEKCS